LKAENSQGRSNISRKKGGRKQSTRGEKNGVEEIGKIRQEDRRRRTKNKRPQEKSRKNKSVATWGKCDYTGSASKRIGEDKGKGKRPFHSFTTASIVSKKKGLIRKNLLNLQKDSQLSTARRKIEETQSGYSPRRRKEKITARRKKRIL